VLLEPEGQEERWLLCVFETPRTSQVVIPAYPKLKIKNKTEYLLLRYCYAHHGIAGEQLTHTLSTLTRSAARGTLGVLARAIHSILLLLLLFHFSYSGTKYAVIALTRSIAFFLAFLMRLSLNSG
jgi:hypothetical protein